MWTSAISLRSRHILWMISQKIKAPMNLRTPWEFDDFCFFVKSVFPRSFDSSHLKSYLPKPKPNGNGKRLPTGPRHMDFCSHFKVNGKPTLRLRRLQQWRCVRTVAIEQCLLSSFLCVAKEEKETSKTNSPRSIGRDEGTKFITSYHHLHFFIDTSKVGVSMLLGPVQPYMGGI